MTEILENWQVECNIPIGGAEEQYLHLAFAENIGTMLLVYQNLPPIKIECIKLKEGEWVFTIPVMEARLVVRLRGRCAVAGTIMWELATSAIADEEYTYIPIGNLWAILCGIYGKPQGERIADALDWFISEGIDILNAEEARRKEREEKKD